MTVRVTTLKGGEAGRYYTEQLPSYYLDAGEPPGRWFGQGAALLGLQGMVENGAFLAVMAGEQPTAGGRLGRRYGDGSVRGFDATFSAPKSVSVLFALGDSHVRGHVVEAHDRAVDAVLGWVESQAHTRMRRRGHVVCVDTEGIIVGVFRQHTSRKLDPQLHTHAVIANRVKAPDGRWLALDARTLKMDQRSLSGLYHAGLRAELTRRLGVGWESPVNGIAEITGIDPDVLVEFSQRSRDVDQRVDAKLRRFVDDLGREPTARERWRLEREAVVDSRPAKPQGHTARQLHDEWRQRTRALGVDPVKLVADATGRLLESVGIDQLQIALMVERALESLAERQSTWRPAHLVRELAAQVPTDVTVRADELAGFLQRLGDHVTATRCVDLSPPAPTGVPLRRDGRPITEPAVDRVLTTRAILDQEQQILEWADRKPRIPAALNHLVTRDLDVAGLSPGQADACRAVAGLAPLEFIVGPAGSGKTTALTPAIAYLQHRGHTVFGVAPTAAAAHILATETGIVADTLDKLLYEHSRPDRLPEPPYDLGWGATVIADEAGTVSTPKLAELVTLADRHGWRVIMVGDPRQFSAVGRGGMFTHLTDTYGAIELDTIHRFTHPWEAEATRRLRTGDISVIADYDRHGRIHGGTVDQMETAIVEAWAEARGRGESVALMTTTNHTVDRLNHQAQHHRIEAGELDPHGPSLRRDDGQRLLVGDEVVTRRNQRNFRTDRGVMVKNRDHWTIRQIHPDGSVTVTGAAGTVRLPASYTGEHLELGYAHTSYTTQGRTVLSSKAARALRPRAVIRARTEPATPLSNRSWRGIGIWMAVSVAAVAVAVGLVGFRAADGCSETEATAIERYATYLSTGSDDSDAIAIGMAAEYAYYVQLISRAGVDVGSMSRERSSSGALAIRSGQDGVALDDFVFTKGAGCVSVASFDRNGEPITMQLYPAETGWESIGPFRFTLRYVARFDEVLNVVYEMENRGQTVGNPLTQNAHLVDDSGEVVASAIEWSNSFDIRPGGAAAVLIQFSNPTLPIGQLALQGTFGTVDPYDEYPVTVSLQP